MAWPDRRSRREGHRAPRLTPDTELVTQFIQGLLGVIWIASGCLMIFNPPPEDYDRSAQMPFIGWMVLAGGVYLVGKVLFASQNSAKARKPEASTGRAVTLLLACGVCFIGGAAAIGIGVNSGLLSVVGAGTAILALSVLVPPLALASKRQ